MLFLGFSMFSFDFDYVILFVFLYIAVFLVSSLPFFFKNFFKKLRKKTIFCDTVLKYCFM